MILGPFSARPPSVELIDQEPATRRQATVMKFNLTRRNARFQGETPTSICIACETSPRVLSRRPAGTTRCESSSKARWLACGRGSVGRASPCQGEGREFESRHPLWFPKGTSAASLYGEAALSHACIEWLALWYCERDYFSKLVFVGTNRLGVTTTHVRLVRSSTPSEQNGGRT